MTKKKSTAIPKFPLKAETFYKLGSGLKQIFVVAAEHPATAALGIMAVSVAAQCLFKPMEISGKSQTATEINKQLGGLYMGAQGALVALAVTPIIVKGLETAAAFAPKPSTAASGLIGGAGI